MEEQVQKSLEETFLDDDWLRREARKATFRLGEGEITLSQRETGVVSLCYQETCHDLGEGEELYDVAMRILGALSDGQGQGRP